jgi:peptidoglycan hydrolase CwlO-like protein
VAIKKDILVSCTDTKQIKEAIKDVDLDNDIISQYSELEAKNTETKKNLDELQTKLEECKSKLVHKPTTTASR